MELDKILKEKIIYIELYDGYSLIKHEEMTKAVKMIDNLVCKVKELEKELLSCKFTIQEQDEEIEALNRIINYGETKTPKEEIKEPEEWEGLQSCIFEAGKEKEFFAEEARLLREALENGKNTI